MVLQPASAVSSEHISSWFALYTMPQNEQSVRRMLDIRQIESFLPTYEVQRVWKNRQRVKSQRPLFPSYLFVRINSHQRGTVLSAPGAVRFVGNGRSVLPIPDREIEILRKVSHENILQLYGVRVENARVLMYTEFMDLDCLKLYKRLHIIKDVEMLEKSTSKFLRNFKHVFGHN